MVNKMSGVTAKAWVGQLQPLGKPWSSTLQIC